VGGIDGIDGIVCVDSVGDARQPHMRVLDAVTILNARTL